MSNYSNYRKIPLQFNVGFLPENAADLRIKQGLAPQNVSSACACVLPVQVSSPCAKCDQTSMYPAKQVQLSYGIPEVPDGCPCTRYVRAP